MKFAFLLSGAFGFVLVAVVGLSADRPIDLVLRDGAIACLGTALVGRWFWRTMERAFTETAEIRRAAAAAQAEAEEAAAQAPATAPISTAKNSTVRPATAK